MKKKLRFLIRENRVGVAKKIVDVLTYKNINILKMEIESPYISMELDGDVKIWNNFHEWIKEEVAEIIESREIDMLDLERKATELQTAINSMTVALIAIGELGEIRYINKKAEELFNIDERDIQMNINRLIPSRIYNINQGLIDEDSIEITETIRGRDINGILDVRTIKSEEGREIGALLLFRDMDEVREMVHTISRPSMNSFEEIIGDTYSIRRSKDIAKSVAKTESSVMILGESGTGKELFARAIHLESNRSRGPFVAVNCSAVPDSLMESEFFGYEKGAFTGASSYGKQGLFELATGGSLFLDEIGDLPIHLQAKILRAIQEKKIRRVGGNKEIDIDIRIISATHRDLLKMVKEKTFREDLYYRLNVVPVVIEPLRERKDDIILLSNYFIQMFGSDMGKENIKISEEAEEILLNYHWPGNVRELQNVIERAMIFSRKEINPEHLMLNSKLVPVGKIDMSNEFPVNLPKILEELEYEYIREASKIYKSSREIGSALGISHTTVINRMNKMKKES